MITKTVILNSEKIDYAFDRIGNHQVRIKFNNLECSYKVISQNKDRLILESENRKQFTVFLSESGHFIYHGQDYNFKEAGGRKKKTSEHDDNQMLSPMPGKILKIMVTEGQEVKKGDPLLIMEAMKMEHTIKASKDGIIEKIDYQAGDQVAGGIELILIV